VDRISNEIWRRVFTTMKRRVHLRRNRNCRHIQQFLYCFQLDTQYCQFYKLFTPLYVSGDIRPSSGGPCY
jgi:hypothetical protein